MTPYDTPVTRRQAQLLEQAKALPTDKARTEFIAQVRQQHGRFAASLLRADLNAWHQDGRPAEGKCTA